MSAIKIKAGDRVRQKSDGKVMEVIEVRDDAGTESARCSYSGGEKWFPLESLEKMESNRKSAWGAVKMTKVIPPGPV